MILNAVVNRFRSRSGYSTENCTGYRPLSDVWTPDSMVRPPLSRLEATLLGFRLAKKSPELNEIVRRPRWITRQRNDFELRKSLADAPCEQDATHSRKRAAAGDLPGCLPEGRRTVDGALTGDDNVVATRVEADEVEDKRRAGHQLRAERRERCA